jgi:uncharacterized protein YggE
MRTIRTTGSGLIRLQPDTTCITMTLTGLAPDYGEALRRSSADTETLRGVLTGFGFARTDLKTLGFHVSTEYESYQDENNTYRERFAGYRFRHVLKVEFDSDNDRLGKVLYALANGSVSPELRISFTVRDQEAAKKTLLAKAVADAREKAELLALAGGVALRDIQTIDYSWGAISFESAPLFDGVMAKSRMAAGASYDLAVEPDEIEVSDTVTVTWEIL